MSAKAYVGAAAVINLRKRALSYLESCGDGALYF